MTGKRLPRGVRNHNPGNIEWGDPWQGLVPEADRTDERFCQFVSAPYGIRALARVLITYQDRHKLASVREMIGRWAPPNENDTGAYVDSVAGRLGVHADNAVNVHEYAVMRPLVEAIIRHENGIQPYTDAQLDKGLALAGIEPPAKPLAASRTVKGAQVAAGATVAGVAIEPLVSAIQAAAPALPHLRAIAEAAPIVFAVLALIGVGYVVYARWDDLRRLAR